MSENLENKTLKELVALLDKEKDALIASYDPEGFYCTNQQCEELCTNILQEIHNRICASFGIEPTVVNTKIRDYKFSMQMDGRLKGGFYSYDSKTVEMGLLVNTYTESPTYYAQYLNSAWTAYTLNNLLHETYHHIQMSCLHNDINNLPYPKSMKTEVKALHVHFMKNGEFENSFVDYYLSSMEMPARKFSQQTLADWMKQGILPASQENTDYMNYLIISEAKIAGKNLTYLKQSHEKNLKYASENYIENVNLFFGEYKDYYEDLQSQCKQLDDVYSAYLDKEKQLDYVKYLSTLDKHALAIDHRNYSRAADKQAFLNKAKEFNEICSRLHLQLSSELPVYLNFKQYYKLKENLKIDEKDEK